MSLKEILDRDLKEALKAKDGDKVSIIRMVRSVLKNKEIDDKKEADDQVVIAVISGMIKKTAEAITQFEAGNRQDLVDKSKKEIETLKIYLPEQISEEELEKLVLAAIAESAAASPKDMGKVMKALLPKVAGRADGKMISSLVQKKLQK
jgi:hypothetical protein